MIVSAASYAGSKNLYLFLRGGKMAKCNNCGSEIADNAKFCTTCGAAQGGQTQAYQQGFQSAQNTPAEPKFLTAIDNNFVLRTIVLVIMFAGIEAFLWWFTNQSDLFYARLFPSLPYSIRKSFRCISIVLMVIVFFWFFIPWCRELKRRKISKGTYTKGTVVLEILFSILWLIFFGLLILNRQFCWW